MAGLMRLLLTLRIWGEMIKFSHSVFALPFAVVATALASRHRPHGAAGPAIWALLAVCMVSARSFAMTINRLADVEFDRRNPRTAGRPLVVGTITRRGAAAFAAAAALVFLVACAGYWLLESNVWPVRLAPVVLAYLAAYSFAKRVTSLTHFLLGLSIASAPVAAWIAVHPDSLGAAALLLMAAAATWIAGFDVIYACQDVDADRRERLYSLPARLGVAGALWVSRGCHVATVVFLGALGAVERLGPVYAGGVAVVAALLLIEQSLVRASDLSRVNTAFFTINGYVGLVFAVTALADVCL